MDKFSLLYICAFLLITAQGCSNNNDSDVALLDTEPLCKNTREFYFSGLINDNLKCFNNEVKNHQIYSGGDILGSEAPHGRFIIGIDTWPINDGDETIYIYTPKVNTTDVDDIFERLPLGELSLAQRQDFMLHYRVVLDVAEIHNMKTYMLTGKFDKDSSINIYKIEKYANHAYPGTVLKISMLVSCKLYDNDQMLTGTLEKGNLTGLIYVDD